MTHLKWQSALKTLESKKYSAILCKNIAHHLHYLYVIAPGFFEAEKRFTLLMNLWEMLHILLLHIVKELRYGIRRVHHVQTCLKKTWFDVCIPWWVLKVFKFASIWFCKSPNSFNFGRMKFCKKRRKVQINK